MSYTVFPQWQDQVVFSPEGPQPKVLEQNDRFKVVLAGLEPGQKIPVHPESSSVFHILEGKGWMNVSTERVPIQAGSIIILGDDVARGMEASTRLVFLAVRMGPEEI